MGDVGQLVGEHALELLGVSMPQDAGGHADHGALGRAAGRERVGDVECRRSPTRGFGMSASAQSRSIMPCSSGASSGVTSRARIARIATLSEEHHW